MLKRIRALFGKRAREFSDARAAAAEDAGEVPRPPIHRGPQVVYRPIPAQDLDLDAAKIIGRLTRFDHTAYLVGGCVRDLLLDHRPKDFDIGTSATPRQVKRLFRNCRIIGRRFRLAHIYFQNNKVIEVATFRTRDDEDSAEPVEAEKDEDLLIREDNVFGTPEEDALRRDFTINSLFYDVNTQTVLDHADGLGDLRRRFVRAIGDPAIRFREDPIRILRAIRFAARLGFKIEANTLKALLHLREEIPKAATPRILEEINRLCRGGAARRSFELLRETQVFEVILPEYAEGYRRDRPAWDHLMQLLDGMDRRHAEGHEASAGGIFAVLLLPLVAKRIGWRKDGTAEQPRGLNVRELADEILRPTAVRLRVGRRDQEHCRQTFMTLFRMVPVRRVRRNTKRSILRRECFPDALWILQATAARYGREFDEATDYWRQSATKDRPGSKLAEKRPEAAASSADEASKKKRGRRRPRPRKRPAAGESPEKGVSHQASRPANGEKAKQAELPPPWDDRYFFAALPTVPKLREEKGKADRYGGAALAAKVEGDTENVGADPARAESATKKSPRGSRPRRRRRSKSRSRSGNDGESTS